MRNLIWLLLFSTQLYADLDERELNLRNQMLKECKQNSKYGNLKVKVRCGLDFHHYNPDTTVKSKQRYNRKKALRKGKIKISEFNVLHPGMGKTRFKDYRKVAQIINEFDIIGVTELIPLTQDDQKNNQNVIDFLTSAPLEIEQTKKEIKSLEQSIAHSSRGTRTKQRELYLLKRKLEKIEADKEDAKKVFRIPGYLKILQELRKLYNGSEWSLILSPQGEGSATTSTNELVGYYYRTSIIRPKANKYCKSRKEGKFSPIACIVNLDKKDMGEDMRNIISRRPFLAEFISGNFSFTLISSHVLFEEPGDPELQKEILRKAFGVESHTELGIGASRDKYARFAEVKLALEFIERNLRGRGHQKDIIFMGDLNLESTNRFWPNVLDEWRGSKLFIEDATSLKKKRYNSDGSESQGKSSNYDHFIFDPAETDECIDPQTDTIDGGILDFVKGKYSGYINRMYKVRNEQKILENSFASFFSDFDYEVNRKKYNKLIKRYVTPKLEDDPIYTVGRVRISYGTSSKSFQGIMIDEKESQDFADKFRTQVLDTQMYNETYYSYFGSLVSDHYPIHMSCSTK